MKLPPHLTDNKKNKAFVYRHLKLNGRKPVHFPYTRDRSRAVARKEAIAYALKMDKELGPPPPTSPEGRMTARNSSGEVGVDPRVHHVVKKTGREYTYYYWRADWVGCPRPGGVSWSCLEDTEEDAYVLAVLTRRMRTINKDEVRARFAKLPASKYDEILSQRPNEVA
jgi:hypothetical protein